MLIGRNITIVGAGIGGLTAALALAMRGAQVRVLEQSEALREVGAGLQISPNGAAVLHALGLGPDLAKIGVAANAIELRDGPSDRKVTLLPTTNYHFVHRADLLAMLEKAVRAAGVQIKLLQQVDTVTEDDRGLLLTTLQRAQCRPDLLIGADGLHSKVRTHLNGPSKPRFTGQVAWRALVPADQDVPAQATLYMGPGRHAVTYPLREGKLLNVVAVEERSDWVAESWSHADDPANLRAAFASFNPRLRAVLERAEQVHLWGLFRHPVAPKWHNQHAAILGDAAHPTLPFLAQGANMAIEDAWALAAALSSTPETGQALAAYQAARAPRTARLVDAAAANARNFHISFPPKRLAAQVVLRTLGRIAPQVLTNRLRWIYDYDVTREFD
ncbi:monooxygenase [Actibacterium mucosum KCTC 23349]|uniref:Monooxygenase n=1 Tax=Actibacterium mucosum KCTC 23349 TaxID=1454373 RepID=A0A037ZGP2_9RHOB|nr:FAD-dependent monooxygenase [Actibacterium mucosum]KAJ55630.1 monooxygenase [Actibacterium mucosum KCTC 23349]